MKKDSVYLLTAVELMVFFLLATILVLTLAKDTRGLAYSHSPISPPSPISPVSPGPLYLPIIYK